MRILFLNHTGVRSGGEHALLRLLESLPREHERSVAAPAGPLGSALEELGIKRHPLPGTDLSFRLHPVHTPVGLARLGACIAAATVAVRRSRAEVVHANGLRAGLIGCGVRALGGPPLVVQCHDMVLQGRAGDTTRSTLDRWADAIVANSFATAASFDRGLAEPSAEVVYISIDHERFSPPVAAADLRTELTLAPDTRLVGQVGQITPWKGQDTSVSALARLREWVDAHLVIVGHVAFQSRRYDNAGFYRALREQATRLGVRHAVHFTGERTDVPNVLKALDLLLMPSWNEPFGLVAVEAMAVGTPALVTATGGAREFVRDGVSGRVLPHDQPAAWAEAIGELLAEPARLKAMSAHAIAAVSRFNDAAYYGQMLDIYERVRTTRRGRVTTRRPKIGKRLKRRSSDALSMEEAAEPRPSDAFLGRPPGR